MDFVSNIVNRSFSSNASGRDWAYAASLGVAALSISYFIVTKASELGFFCAKKKSKGTWVNPDVRKEDSKVVDSCDIEDIGEKKVFCRCWRSASFPYCDGAHNKHNLETGDNVGPLIVGKKKSN
ncbi:CDGSH iron-sulfur domain-containing protein 1-like [Daphnia carinata]|uniref:CDGSH iron-sulfur domain-containing protein 1-like n=1 Tax=Daphnia carinata TaxID=120202 RepID=UPI002579B696|nr:CDGSH iron-sulfur domain-containing protein 1-like [Daphnia carinata]